MGIKILALQELALNFLNLTITSNNWSTVYPSTHATAPDKTRSITLISTTLNMNSWEQIKVPSGDITAIQIKGRSSKLTIYNIYNDCKSNATIRLLTARRSIFTNTQNHLELNRLHTIWLGNFNRHHPYWDNPDDERLFTTEAIEEAKILIEAVADAGLELILPSGILTHIHNVTKKWSRLDQVFLSDHSLDLLIACETTPDLRGIKMDHLPVITELNLGTSGVSKTDIHNFREVEWDKFKEYLDKHLQHCKAYTPIRNQ
jgi:exonuclease III